MIEKLIMWYKHMSGTNTGKTTFWVDEHGRNCVGFECECGEIHGKAIIKDEHIDNMLTNLKIEKNEIS